MLTLSIILFDGHWTQHMNTNDPAVGSAHYNNVIKRLVLPGA